MPNIKITQLFSYPIKSTTGNQLDHADYTASGFRWDRAFAIINRDNQILTIRENQDLLSVKSYVEGEQLKLTIQDGDNYHLNLAQVENTVGEIGIFSDRASARIVDDPVNEYLSHAIGESCRLVMLDEEKLRTIPPEYYDESVAPVHFCDLAPIHLVSEASIDDLNAKLAAPVTVANFRPNLVVSGVQAFEEDQWREISIGGVRFKAFHKTSRCVATTVDPNSMVKSQHGEPLKTMASYRTENHKVKFGIYLIPMSSGILSIGDEIVVSQ